MKPNSPVVTITLIGISIAVAVFSQLGRSDLILDYLFIADPNTGGGFDAIESGEVWRLLTPIFIHFGIMHIVFNMMWMWDLGRMVEWRCGSLFLSSFIIVVGVAIRDARFTLFRRYVWCDLWLAGFCVDAGKVQPTLRLCTKPRYGRHDVDLVRIVLDWAAWPHCQLGAHGGTIDWHWVGLHQPK